MVTHQLSSGASRRRSRTCSECATFFKLLGKKPVVLMHQSESEVWFMEQAVKDGERIFDWVVHNKFSLGVLCDMAGDCIQSLSTFQ